MQQKKRKKKVRKKAERVSDIQIKHTRNFDPIFAFS